MAKWTLTQCVDCINKYTQSLGTQLCNEPYLLLDHSIKMVQRGGYFVQLPLRGMVFCCHSVYILQQGDLYAYLENRCTCSFVPISKCKSGRIILHRISRYKFVLTRLLLWSFNSFVSRKPLIKCIFHKVPDSLGHFINCDIIAGKAHKCLLLRS